MTILRLKENIERDVILEPYPEKFRDESELSFGAVELCAKNPDDRFLHRACLEIFHVGGDWFIIGDVPTLPESTNEMIEELKKKVPGCYVEDIHEHRTGKLGDQNDIHLMCHFAFGSKKKLERLWQWVNIA